MNIICEELSSFIDERLNNNFSKLRSNSNYNDINNKYCKCIDTFRNELPKEMLNKFENVIDLINSLHSEEIFFCYSLGLTDGIKLENHISKI